MTDPDIIQSLSAKAGKELRNLLENKHLYQSASVDPKEFVDKRIAEEPIDVPHRNLTEWSALELPKKRFVPASEQMWIATREGPPIPELTLIITNASMFCKACESREAFRPVWYTDASNEILKQGRDSVSSKAKFPATVQMLLLVYQCQSCLGAPESFPVRRDGWTLGLHGRSPIEFVQLAKYIPKPESSFFSDALLAYNSGKTLAALFYLRTFVEQFARRLTGIAGRATGEEILDAYYANLPSPEKDQMPSLREWYDKLSEALHSAKADISLFDTARGKIEKHFEIRKVFNMRETADGKQP